MRQFIRTSVPAEGYEEVKQVGEMYVVHLEPSGVDQQTGTLTCYETTTATEPDIEELTAELQVWKEYMAGRELAIKKQVKIAALVEYDQSSAVNSFTINVGGGQIEAWLTPDQRANYKNSLDSAELLGMDVVHPVINGMTFELQVATAKMYLAQIQIYADKCYNVTETHKAAINALESVESVEAYGYTTGYPQRLTFEI